MKHKIYELSARMIMRNAKLNDDGVYEFNLSENATKKCINPASPPQDDCALFYQIQQVIENDNNIFGGVANHLHDVLIYVDFSRVFDRQPTQKKYIDWQKMAEDMFRPEGITLDFGYGYDRYIAFERSASMSRNARLSFIREDLYEPVRKRIMLDMQIGKCQLSKLYAYNGLMLTDGFRTDDMDIWNSDRIIVIDNPITTVHGVDIITVEDDGTDNAMRKYKRVEKLADVDVTEFDGEGLISFQYAKTIDELMNGGKEEHTSFQVRMPYVKGILHKVDFKKFLAEYRVFEIKDMWGVYHPIEKVDIILTKSMFKGCGWMEQNGMTWYDYLAKCKEYRHSLYISEVSQVKTSAFTEMNYQFLVTATIMPDEFRPSDLPLGWDNSPSLDKRDWITKATEQRYYDLVANEKYRTAYIKEKNPDWAKILKLNPKFIDEPFFTKQLDNQAKKILQQYSIGRLIAAGDNRYLSGDLIYFLEKLVKNSSDETVIPLEQERLREGEFYAPYAEYAENDSYVLLRNPHIARNEEAVARPIEEVGYFRKNYLSHLNYVIMVDSSTLIPERLGGADFDGDMIKTIAEPLMNECVARNYGGSGGAIDRFTVQYPLLKIPSAEPLMRDANDWRARMETVKNTFNARIGQICNAAFDRSIIAYDESKSEEERKKMREETETLEILTGLEIDSAKSGVKPDLSEYLNRKIVNRSSFLQYKNIVKSADSKQWYKDTQKQKLDKFFASTDWNSVSANVEKLPYFAKMLERHTPRLKPTPANDEELFQFAREKSWKDKLNPEDLELMKSVIADYEEAHRRIRISRIATNDMKRRSDVERILFARGQEEEYTADELYGLFAGMSAEHITEVRRNLTEQQFHLMDYEERVDFIQRSISSDNYAVFDYMEFFADFRCNGYRIFGDIICDYDDSNTEQQRKENALRNNTESELINAIMRSYKFNDGIDYEHTIKCCVTDYLRKMNLSGRTALKCAIALEKRQFAYDVLLFYIEYELKEENNAKRKRGIPRLHR
ncbi:MAG: hypothetical protein IJ643_11075 [Eubacterium sp.]|nr:hypothetical protein [Eubacterium sp.]